MSSDRFERQQALVPREALTQLEATVIGVGAIGQASCCATGVAGSKNVASCGF